MKIRYRMTAWHCIGTRQVREVKTSLHSSDEEALEWFSTIYNKDSTIHEARLEAVKGNRHIMDYIGYV